MTPAKERLPACHPSAESGSMHPQPQRRVVYSRYKGIEAILDVFFEIYHSIKFVDAY
jgi:hypothetical protein